MFDTHAFKTNRYHRLPERTEGLERRPACAGGRSHRPLRHCWLGFDPAGANLVILTPPITFTLVTSPAARAFSSRVRMRGTIRSIGQSIQGPLRGRRHGRSGDVPADARTGDRDDAAGRYPRLS